MSEPAPPSARSSPSTDLATRRHEESRHVTEAIVHWRRRSRLIHFTRRALPAAIGLIVVLMLGWIVFATVRADRAARSTGDIRLTNARFYGQDARGRSFLVAAGTAVQVKRRAGLFRLENPRIEADSGAERPTVVTARSGFFDQNAQGVRLQGDVTLVDPINDFRFTSPEAVVDMKTGVISGARGIQGSGPTGSVQATSYSITDGGRRIEFHGSGDNKVRGTLNASPRAGSR